MPDTREALEFLPPLRPAPDGHCPDGTPITKPLKITATHGQAMGPDFKLKKKMETKFEQRLREVLAEYRNADPEKVKAALQAHPGASNYYVAILSGVSFEEAERVYKRMTLGAKGYQLKYSYVDPERVEALLKRLEEWEKAKEERAALKDKDLH